jgi:hypothetical protein
MTDHPEAIRQIIDSVDPVTAAEARGRADAGDASIEPPPGARRRPALVLAAAAVAATLVVVVIVVATRSPGPSTVDTTHVGTTVPTTISGPAPTVLPPVGDDPLVTCDVFDQTWFRISAWSGPATGEGLDLPAADVLRRQYLINDMARINGVVPPYPDVPIESWRLLRADETEVLWGLGDFDLDQVNLDTIGPILTFVRAELVDGGWQPASVGAGSCNELSVKPPAGASNASWGLPEVPGPDATSFPITVYALDRCDDLTPGDLLGPDVVETDDAVTIRVAIDRPPVTIDDRLACEEPEHREMTTVTVTVNLAAPLGDRELLDAGLFPAGPVIRLPGDDPTAPGSTEPP